MSCPSSPSYHQIHTACSNLQAKMQQDNIKIDYILGLTRGGLLPAVILSHLLNVKMIPIEFSSYDGEGSNRESEWYSNDVHYLQNLIDPNSCVLIVDEIVDSGNTLLELISELTNMGFKSYSSALYVRNNSIIKPDYYNWQINTDMWITFPWECEDEKEETDGIFFSESGC